MERIRDISLLPIVALTALLTLLTTVLVFIGFPLAGVGSAIACAAGATGLTAGLVFAFAHGAESNHS